MGIAPACSVCLVPLLVLVLVTASLGAVAAQTARNVRLDGGFIQYQGWMMKMDRAAWARELDAMRVARMKTLILQFLQNGNERYIPSDASAPDPTAAIMDYADKHAMRIYVGLATDSDWWARATETAYLDHAAEQSCALAEEAWKRYGRHSSFAGWYIPQELWDGNWTDDAIDRLRGFLKRVSDRCRRLSGDRPVLLSPFFSGVSKPDSVERTYAKLLEGAGIDVLLPQDGVGARHWDDDPASHVIPYFRAFRLACLSAGVELWANVESFRIIHGAPMDSQPQQFASASIGRLERQIVAESPFVNRLVTFDLFHYLSPYRNADSKALYSGYVREFVERRFEPALGRAVEVDPLFPYYRDRSPESIAQEIRANGYNVVDYVITADSDVNPALIEAFRAEGIGVWYSTFGNGTYLTKDLPKGWESWKMVTRSDLEGKPLNDGYTRLCLNNPDYRAWKKAQIVRMLRRYRFAGVNIVEPHWPEYPGTSSEAYACFCAHCAAAFRRMFPGEKALPDILHADSPNSPKQNPALWHKWLEFRHRSLTGFLNDLVNGKGGVREKAPSKKVCVWTLALTEKNGLQRVKEDSGEDPAEIARVVEPDVYCFQTHWPDWIRADLPPSYVRDYRPFVQSVRSVAPDMPIKIQADTGSQKQNRWGWDWVRTFERECGSLGAGSTTIYEYFIGKYMYTDPPAIAEVRSEPGGVRLLFTKRLDARSASDPDHYALDSGRVTAARVDGSVVHVTLEGLQSGRLCTLTVRGIADAADRRLYKDFPPAVLDAQVVRFRAGG